MLEDYARTGAGTPEAEQIVNTYVLNYISNSTKVVTLPPTLQDTADYEKVVVDGSPAPKPDPDPDPTPTPDPDPTPTPDPDPTPTPDPDPSPDPGVPGDGETTAQKIEKFLKLPVQQLFPFCLVYDIQLLVEHVAGGSAAYADGSLLFEFDVGFGYFDSPLVIDLSGYEDMRGAFHMAFDVLLVAGLLYFSISLFLKARSD